MATAQRQTTGETVLEGFLEGFPKNIEIEGRDITLRLMETEDGPRLLEFAQGLPQHDLLFLRRDITTSKGIEAWLRDIREGNMNTILAEEKGAVLGYSSLYRHDFDWSRHVAELRVLVGSEARKTGLGRLLTREAFNLALVIGVEKVVGRMTLDQTGARTVFEELGFRPEALLKNEVKDRNGNAHDVLLVSCDVQEFLARREMYGAS